MRRRSTSIAIAALACAVASQECSRTQQAHGSARAEARTAAHTGLSQPTAAEAPSAKVVRFTPYRCVDAQGLGIEAFQVLVPAGWSFDGGIYWRLDNPGFPAYAACRVSSPDGLEAFEVFPNLPYFWTDNPMTARLFPPGSKYFGNTVRQPVGASEALRLLVLPAFRGGVNGLQIRNEAAVPELAGMVRDMQSRMQPEANIQVDAGKVRIEYTTGGQAMEEEMYAVVQTFSFSLATMYGAVTNQNWWVDYIFSCRAARGRLDSGARLLQTIAFSFRVNPRWFAGYSNVVEYLIRRQIQQIRTIGEIGRIYAQTGSEIREDQMRTWEANQAVRDRMSKEWSQAFRGVDEYYDPFAEKAVELPSGYDNAWVSPLGDYVVSDSPSYDPNVGSNQTWQQMRRR